MSNAQSWILDYLLNAAWQVPLLFATAWVAARLLRAAGPSVEHRIWASALVLETFLPACSLPSERLTTALNALQAWLFGVKQTGGAQVTVFVGEGYVHGGLRIAPTLLTVVAAFYIVSILYFAVRLMLALYRTATLQRSAKTTMLLAASGRRYEHIFRVREPIIATSTKVNGPVTLGIWRHTILLPGVIHTELSEDIEAALAHEFAHIARNDFAKNLAYELLSLPVAFHPLLWLTRRRVAESREMICDAMAAAAVEGRQRYARSLLRLASEFATRTPAVSTHAIGIFDANTFRNFERRVMSLTEKRVEMQGARRSATIALSLTLAVGVCTSAMALRMQVANVDAGRSQFVNDFAAPRTAEPTQTTTATQTTQAAPDPIPVAAPHQARVEPPKTMKVVSAPVVMASASTDPLSELKSGTTSQAASSPPQADAMKQQQELSSARPVPAEVMSSQILMKTQPVYPAEAKAAKISGSVVLKAVIGKDGKMQALRLLDGPKELAGSAMEAVRQWVYKPYLLNGQPTEVETTITVNYSLAGQP